MKLKDGYYAKDQDGNVYWHEELPVKGATAWLDNTSHSGATCILIDGPWKDSLHRVEDGKITKIQTYSKDQKVLVSDDGKNCYDRRWYKRYYSHYKDGDHYVFANGKTSWSQDGTSVFAYIKSAEEE